MNSENAPVRRRRATGCTSRVDILATKDGKRRSYLAAQVPPELVDAVRGLVTLGHGTPTEIVRGALERAVHEAYEAAGLPCPVALN